jgi:hypothetical protein
VLPIIVAYIAYKIHDFPKELGKKVSKSVRNGLDSKFDNINETILESIFDTVFKSNELMQAIVDDEEFRGCNEDFGEEVEPSLKKVRVSRAKRWTARSRFT